MAKPLTTFQEPGFFSQIKESPSLFLLPGSIRSVGLIGKGKATKTVLEESLERLDAGGFEDTLANPVASITKVFSDAIFEYPRTSYGLSITGTAEELFTFGGTETLKFTFAGVAIETAAFAGADDEASEVVTVINTAISAASLPTGAVLTAIEIGGNKVKLLTGTAVLGDGGINELKIGDGDANSILGFVENAVAQDIDWEAQNNETVNGTVRPLNTEKYFVDYESPKVAADFAPKVFFGLDQVSAEYGDPSATNTLSLGALAAFGNGASIIWARQLDPAVDLTDNATMQSQVVNALADYEKIDVNYLVPMVPVNTFTIVDEMLTHVTKMSSKRERKERTTILSVDETAARLTILGGAGTWEGIMSSFTGATNLEPKRVMMLNPGSTKTTIKGIQITTDGTYLAACMAGLRASPAFDTAEPMTRKAMATVDELIAPDLSRSEKNSLTSLGVTVIERNGANIIIRRAMTADSSSVASQEPSIVDAFDQVAKELRSAMENRFVGSKIFPNGSTRVSLEAATNRFLERFVADEIIGAFRAVKATQNSVEPRQFDITFEAVPIFPFLWGSLEISITLA